MFFSRPLVVAAGLLLPAVLARTDLQGCTSSATVAYGGASLIWYVPDTGEICSFLDCGGGRAPPITTRPGCNGYTGTATVTPSFLPGFGAAAETGATAGGGVSATMSTEPLPSATEAVSSSLSLSSSTEPSSFSTTLADSLTTAPATLPVSATSSATVSTKEETSATTKDHTASTKVSTLPGKTVISSSTKTTGSSSGTATSKSTQASAVVTGAADTIRAMGVSGMVGMVAVAGAAGLALL